MMAYIYGIQSGLFIKVGMTSNLANRLREMNLYNPHPCKVVVKRHVYDGARAIELRVHKILAPYALGREWFAVDAPLVRAAITIATREHKEAQEAWYAECLRRKNAKGDRGGIDVGNDSSKLKIVGGSA